MNLSRRIYTVLLAAVGLWCAAIVAIPVLHAFGGSIGQSLADGLSLGFSRVCHQLDDRSIHVFGQKFGVCIRCTSIYFSFLAGLIVYPFIRPLDSANPPGRRWLILAVAPMVLDALLNDLGIHQSGEVSRVLTGSLAGFIFAFAVLPLFIEALKQLLLHRTVQGDSHYAGQTQ
jgi:uncharacterized membrane protein